MGEGMGDITHLTLGRGIFEDLHGGVVDSFSYLKATQTWGSGG